MTQINTNFLKLPGSYLFSEIARRVAAYSTEHTEKKLIKLGIGDVTRPLPAAVIEAMHKAVDEMGKSETFRGYGPVRDSPVRGSFSSGNSRRTSVISLPRSPQPM